MAASIVAAPLGQHVERGGRADRGLGPGGDVGHAVRRRHRQQLGARAGDKLAGEPTSRSVTPVEVLGLATRIFMTGTLLETAGARSVPSGLALQPRHFFLQLLDPLGQPVDGGRDFGLAVARHDVLRAIDVPGFEA